MVAATDVDVLTISSEAGVTARACIIYAQTQICNAVISLKYVEISYCDSVSLKSLKVIVYTKASYRYVNSPQSVWLKLLYKK